MTWVGARWLPTDSPHPFAAEPPADSPPAPSPRPPTIVASKDIEPLPLQRGRVARSRRDLGRSAGSSISGLVHLTIEPGAHSSPRHSHSVEEDLLAVLDSDGVVLLLFRGLGVAGRLHPASYWDDEP